ncbi:alpha/beta hydrolase [Actinoplanes sp. RD1]|uniref:alpha/beta hydrolase n=1 Tax=Actinoplanes sp. RD1 TaxID=3064538 RepID=UPI0027425F0A|nr:alpha/beta hydrolase-fold protein [Actinoplanes sp. RD1]
MTWHDLDLPKGITGRAWTPRARSGVVLVVHDGAEYENRTGLTSAVPGNPVVLLDASDRLTQYSADPAYARQLSRIVRDLGSGAPVVGVGASLGALSLLHAQCRFPVFDGLFLQSGSFFRPALDRQESDFRHWLRIVRFTGRVARGSLGPGVPITLTCGTVEENLANNRDMARALLAQGCPVTFAEVPGGHDWDSWRAALDPHLTALLRRVHQEA